MSRDDARSQKPQAVEVRDNRRRPPLLCGIGLGPGFRNVNQGRHAVFPREIPRRLERLSVVRVDRMRRDGWRNQRVVPEGLDERLRAGERVGWRFCIGNGELDHRFTEDAAKPGGLRFLRDFLLEVIHVREGRRTGLDHLERGQPGSGADELRRDGLRLRGEDVVVQPVHQRQVVREPSVEDHRRVRVRIYQPGHHHLSSGINRVAGPELPTDRVHRVDGDNVRAVDGDAAAADHAAGAVHRHDDPVGDK